MVEGDNLLCTLLKVPFATWQERLMNSCQLLETFCGRSSGKRQVYVKQKRPSQVIV